MWKKMYFRIATLIAPLAFFYAIISAGTASQGGIHQPQVPKALWK